MDSDLRRGLNEISAEGITKTEFPIRVRGYDKDEVDAFLAVVADEMRRLTAASKELAAQSEQPFKALGSEAGKLLQMARAAADRISQEAQADASITRDRAADELAEAEDEGTRTRAEVRRLLEAEAVLKQRVAELTRDKESLSREVEAVRAEADSYSSLSPTPTSDSETDT